jgi:Protein of unknown function (DUF3631)
MTPRLFLTSPTKGCGKSTLLGIKTLAHRPHKADSTTPAAVYHLIDAQHPTLLLDEADNLGLSSNDALRAVLNSGHVWDGARIHWDAGTKNARPFSIFAPLAIAAIGLLPLPLMDRSLVIHLERYSGAEPLERFDPRTDKARIQTADIYRRISFWARHVELDLDPAMPEGMINRLSDNWRPLLSVADSCGAGDVGRKAALEFCKGHRAEDIPVLLLADVRHVFDQLGVYRISGADLVKGLLDLEMRLGRNGVDWKIINILGAYLGVNLRASSLGLEFAPKCFGRCAARRKPRAIAATCDRSLSGPWPHIAGKVSHRHTIGKTIGYKASNP